MGPCAIAGRGILLTAPSEADIAFLHEWESDLTSLYLWSGNRHIYSENEFRASLEARLRAGGDVALMIYKPGRIEPAGIIHSYDNNSLDGHCFVTMYVAPFHRYGSLAARAAVLFFDYLFGYYAFRKIYCDVFDYNSASLSGLQKLGFVIEGTLREHRYHAGSYHDLRRLALYRGDFERNCAHRCEFLKRPGDSKN